MLPRSRREVTRVSDLLILKPMQMFLTSHNSISLLTYPAIFEAEGISAPLNRYLNEHTTELLKLKAQCALAMNEHLVVTGIEGGKAANTLLQANAILAGKVIGSGDQQARAAILSELAVASGSGDVRILVGGGERA